MFWCSLDKRKKCCLPNLERRLYPAVDVFIISMMMIKSTILIFFSQISVFIVRPTISKHIIYLAGGTRGPAAGGDVPQFPGGLLQHDPDGVCGGPGRSQTGAPGPHGHAHRRVPAVHPEHLRRDSLHPSHVGRGHRRRYTGIPDCVGVLLYGKELKNTVSALLFISN